MCIAFMITFAKEVDFIVSSVLFLNIPMSALELYAFFLFS